MQEEDEGTLLTDSNDNLYEPNTKQKCRQIHKMVIELTGCINGCEGTFNYDNLCEESFLAITAITRLIISGIEFSKLLNKEMSLFIQSIGVFFKKAKLTGKWTVPLNELYSVNQMKTITNDLFSYSDLLQLGLNQLNLLELSALDKIPELHICMEVNSILDIGSTGMKRLFAWLHNKQIEDPKKMWCEITNNSFASLFLHTLKMHKEDAFYVILMRVNDIHINNFQYSVGNCSTFQVMQEQANLYSICKYPKDKPIQNPQEIITARYNEMPEIILIY
ncbi:hypothetical protein ACQ4LE_009697 [Meloidogyne hapla]